MAKVRCDLPNASTLISGVAFVPVEDGMISEDLDDDMAERFASIKGFHLVAEKKGKKTASSDSADTNDAKPDEVSK